MGEHFSFGDLHLILLHFPIVWVTTAFICDLIFLFKRNPVLIRVADWMVIAAALIAIPTVITGSVLAGEIDNPALLYHRNAALITLCYTIFHALFRYYSFITGKSSPNYVILSAINLALIDITADYGGLVAFGMGVFI